MKTLKLRIKCCLTNSKNMIACQSVKFKTMNNVLRSMPYLGEFDPTIQRENFGTAISYLNAINQQEGIGPLSAEVRRVLSFSLAMGLREFDELGRFRPEYRQGLAYSPDAFTERYEFIDLSGHLQLNHNILNLSFSDIKPALYDARYYRPSIESIVQTRIQVVGAVTAELGFGTFHSGELVTFDDYKQYLERFHPDLLAIILQHVFAIEPSTHCTGPCVKNCFAGAFSGNGQHMPFSVVELLLKTIQNYQFKKEVAFYGPTDLVDYQDGEHDGVDLLKMHSRILGEISPVSIAFRTTRRALSFLYKLLKADNLILDRISRLSTGIEDTAVDDLISKLKNYAKEQKGGCFDSDMERALRKACVIGEKPKGALTLGNAVIAETAERDIDNIQIGCVHGISFRAGKGFIATTMRPPSKLFPIGLIEWRLIPDLQGNICIPRLTYLEDYNLPTPEQFRAVVVAPKFIVANNNSGKIVSEDTNESQAEIDLRILSDFRRNVVEEFKAKCQDQTLSDQEQRVLIYNIINRLRFGRYSNSLILQKLCRNLI